jgi:hypothetical protein
LAQELENHRRVLRELDEAKTRGDLSIFFDILRVRSRELDNAIERVHSGSFSATDKIKMLEVLGQEKAWAYSSLAAYADLKK